MGTEKTSRMPLTTEIKTSEQILPVISTIVRRAPGRIFEEGLNLAAGEKVFMVTDSTIDPILTAAFIEVIRDLKGHVDLVELEGYPDLTDPAEIVDTMFACNWFPSWVWEGAKQSDVFLRLAFMKFPHTPNLPLARDGTTKPRIVEWELPPDILLASCVTYPTAVWDAIDRKTWELYNGSRRIEITDCEGTELTFDLAPEDWQSQGSSLFHPGHLFIPFPRDRQLAGVIVFRSLTFGGPIPLTRLHIKNRQVREVEGGGEFAERLRKSFDKYRDVTFERLPGPGCNWVSTFALCTNPKYRRSPFHSQARGSTRVHTWCLGHRRSGFIHASIGSALAGPGHKLIRHFELMFPTMVADGKVVIQDGHLVALDDPQVRSVAARYGDPDNLLREEWIPDPVAAI